jgi:hypothetical protein
VLTRLVLSKKSPVRFLRYEMIRNDWLMLKSPSDAHDTNRSRGNIVCAAIAIMIMLLFFPFRDSVGHALGGLCLLMVFVHSLCRDVMRLRKMKRAEADDSSSS